MLASISTLVLLATSAVNGSPMPFDKREPQFSFNFTNRLPVNGRLPFGINLGQGADGNSIATFGNATTGDRGFPFNFLPFKRDEHELMARDPQFQFNFTNRLPVNGRLPFGINIGQLANGNSFATFGNATTGDRGFPFNFLPFKRDEHELQVREPQFQFNFTNRLPVNGRLPFGINIGQLANGNSFATFGNATTGDRGFPFNLLPFKREEEMLAARAEVEKRDPQFSFGFSNRLPVTGNLPFGINIAQGADGNSIANLGNATTGAQPFPFGKRDPQFSFTFSNRLPVNGNLPFGINLAQGADGNTIANLGNATTGAQPFPFGKRND